MSILKKCAYDDLGKSKYIIIKPLVVGRLFPTLICHPYLILFGEFFCPHFYWSVCFLTVEFSELCILDTIPLSHTGLANIFSQSATCQLEIDSMTDSVLFLSE